MRFCESFPVTSQTFLPGEVSGGGEGKGKGVLDQYVRMDEPPRV